MKEISLHIMDIVENSIAANADLIVIEINENKHEDILKVTIKDNGKGIDNKLLKNIKDPFTTSRKTRRVGLGISLFEAACIRCQGNLSIKSKVNVGTEVIAIMKLSHIDRAPLGRMSETICSFLLHKDIEIVYKHSVDDKQFVLDTRELKKIAGEDLNIPEILTWIRVYIDENLDEIGSKKW